MPERCHHQPTTKGKSGDAYNFTLENTLSGAGNSTRKLASRLALILMISSGAVQAQQSSPETSATSEPEIAMNADAALSEQLLHAYQALGDTYKPRTEHLFEDGSPHFINRLINEDSPYLRQHAHNPVNWYPWGEEAFAAAAEQDKPVFLSIGYATCHWCHVMERESFENLEIADVMNEQFIAIKVDREQLPDVDALYMQAVMMINGSGGWPMSSFLDTEGRAFYGGTYFPPEAFTELLTRISQLWWQQPEALLDQATQITEAINRRNDTRGEVRAVGDTQIRQALSAALESFDPDNGGFGGAPKFPRESTLFFLLDQAQRKVASLDNTQSQPSALQAADETLQRMAAGGIHDHVGGGFHRYAVDSVWLVPHFEKMLYNQAALARNYSQAYQLTGKPEHRRTAVRILDYVMRDMTSPDGMFYSATDADSEGEEGRFFIWTPEELAKVLGDEEAKIAARVWNVTGEGNFEGTSILHTPEPLETLAGSFDLSLAQLQNKIDDWSEQLRIARETREHPLRDEKIISSWNGMMISALALGSTRLDEGKYLDAAINAAQGVWNKLRADDGSVYRTYFDGNVSIQGTQADYAYLAEAFVTLYDITGSPSWLDRAVSLTTQMNDKFWDVDSGTYFMGASVVGGASLSARPKDLYDNAIASGNSVALRLLAKLFKRTGEPDYEAMANAMISALSSRIEEQPTAFMYLLTGVNEHLTGEDGSLQYGGRGVLRANARTLADRVVIDIRVADGWHINSNQPLQDYLIPTQLTDLSGEPLSSVTYPKASIQTLGFQRSELSLFDQTFEISAQLPAADKTVVLQIQACNDETCLAPESLALSVF